MSLRSWWGKSSRTINVPPESREEQQELRAELAKQVMRFERRAQTVTQIAEDAIRSMHRGDKK